MGRTVDWLAEISEIRQLSLAYYGHAGDEPNRPSEELLAYLRYCSREGFARAAVAARQIRELLEDQSPEEFAEIADAIPLPTPSGGKSAREWLSIAAGILEITVESHNFPPAGPPVTRFEWIMYYPSLAEIISLAYHQDSSGLHGSIENALAVTIRDSSMSDLARTIGQIHEILAWNIAQEDLIEGCRFMGLGIVIPSQDAKEFILNILRACESEVRLRQNEAAS
jgi:hypothetical protein